MIADVKLYLQMLEETGLTQAQFLFLTLMRNKDIDAILKYKELFPNPEGTFLSDDQKYFLVNNGWIIVNGEGSRLSQLHLTEQAEELFANGFIAVHELIASYPATRTSEGTTYPLTNIKSELVVFSQKYLQIIGASQGLHNKIVKAILEGRRKDYPFAKLETFVNSMGWLGLFDWLQNKGDQKVASGSTRKDREM